jgi:hypothetical protein
MSGKGYPTMQEARRDTISPENTSEPPPTGLGFNRGMKEVAVLRPASVTQSPLATLIESRLPYNNINL